MDVYSKLDELFKGIDGITGVKDIGYHEIKEGRLCPVHKTNTDILGITKWRETHAGNPVMVEGTIVLEELMRTGKPVIVADVNHDSRSAGAFFLFGIDSIMVVPVKEDGMIKGIVCIASIGKLHDFSEDEIKECCRKVEECFKNGL